MPMHPAVVHIPLGLAFIVPFVAFGVLLAVWRGWLPWRAWLVVVLLQAAILGAAFVAKQSGESDGDRIEKVLGKDAVHEHEENAERFMILVAGALLLSLVALPLGARSYGRAVMAIAAVATLGALWMATRAGHSGGELIYEHNAAQVLQSQGGSKMTLSVGESREEGEQGEREEAGEKR